MAESKERDTGSGKGDAEALAEARVVEEQRWTIWVCGPCGGPVEAIGFRESFPDDHWVTKCAGCGGPAREVEVVNAKAHDELYAIATGEADHDPRCGGDCGWCGGSGGVEANRCIYCGGSGECQGCSVGFKFRMARCEAGVADPQPTAAVDAEAPKSEAVATPPDSVSHD